MDKGETMNADLIDFTAEALHRRWVTHHNAGDHAEAGTLSLLINFYLEGVMKVDWQNGEPYFSLTEYGKALTDSISPDDGEEYTNEPLRWEASDGASGDDS